MKSTQEHDARGSRMSRMSQGVGMGGTLAISCLISYALITHHPYPGIFVSQDDDLLGGMWAVVATIFVFRHELSQSVTCRHITDGWQRY